jgi:predicted HD superfamily hydrolase involved in NAD metabolism
MIEMLKEIVKEKLANYPKRYIHVLGVYETAVKLAKIHHVDVEKASIASLFHDYAKHDKIEEQTKYLTKEEIVKYQDTKVIYHAFAAAKILELEFNVSDQDILNSIRYHVWGRKDMSKLEKIIYLSDYSEPNRDFDDAKVIYDLAVKDLDLALEYAMHAGINDVLNKNLEPNIEQIEAYEYYKEVIRGKNK